jgi:hypothetical protein
MHALALMIKPIPYGWAVCLTDGRELARFRGPESKRRALRHLAREAQSLAVPAIVKRRWAAVSSPPPGFSDPPDHTGSGG